MEWQQQCHLVLIGKPLNSDLRCLHFGNHNTGYFLALVRKQTWCWIREDFDEKTKSKETQLKWLALIECWIAHCYGDLNTVFCFVKKKSKFKLICVDYGSLFKIKEGRLLDIIERCLQYPIAQKFCPENLPYGHSCVGVLKYQAPCKVRLYLVFLAWGLLSAKDCCWHSMLCLKMNVQLSAICTHKMHDF